MATFRPGKPRTTLVLTANKNFTGATFIVAWDAEVLPEGASLWTLAAPTLITIPISGTYLAVGSLLRSTVATATRMRMSILVNGASANRMIADTPTSTQQQGCTASFLGHLAVGDTLSVQSAAQAAATTFQKDGCILTVMRVGPDRWTS